MSIDSFSPPPLCFAVALQSRYGFLFWYALLPYFHRRLHRRLHQLSFLTVQNQGLWHIQRPTTVGDNPIALTRITWKRVKETRITISGWKVVVERVSSHTKHTKTKQNKNQRFQRGFLSFFVIISMSQKWKRGDRGGVWWGRTRKRAFGEGSFGG